MSPKPTEWPRRLGRRAFLGAIGLAAANVVLPMTLPLYTANATVTGRISLWGHGSFKHDFLGRLLAAWTRRFKEYQPSVVFENRMFGTASAIGALYTGAGNLALLGEEIHPDAARAFLRAKQYPPTRIQIATGSLDVNYFDYAHMIFVHTLNPIRHLSVAQLEGIFGTEHKRLPHNLRTWDQLGLSGQWRGARIQPYGWKIDEDFGLFFRGAILGGSHRWNPQIREFAHITRPDGSVYEHGRQILDALAHDPCGIAISNLRFANRHVRSLPLAGQDGGPYYNATQASLVAQRYPLTRIIPAFIDRPPGQPVDAKLREFLRFILSREGQQLLVAHSGYLPLSAAAIAQQLDILG
jgi:phosphate transport system substrate-binding protein